VTLSVRVADDAPAGETTISFDETDVTLTGDWPIAVVDESVTVSIDGGDEPLEMFDHPDPDELNLEAEGVGVRTTRVAALKRPIAGMVCPFPALRSGSRCCSHCARGAPVDSRS